MKKKEIKFNQLTYLILILGFSLNLYSQVNDTIRYESGEMMVINSDDWKLIQEKYRKGQTMIIEGNYKKYDKEGNISEEMKIFKYGESSYQKIKLKKGVKVYQEYLNNDGTILTSFWNKKGQLYYEEKYMDDYAIFTKYYQTKLNPLKSILKKKLLNQYNVIEFIEPNTLNYWNSIRDSTKNWIPVGEYIEFYENGNLKMKGEYLPAKFRVFKTKNDFEKSKENSNVRPISILKHAKAKKWIYYNEDGKIEKTDTYKNGILIPAGATTTN